MYRLWMTLGAVAAWLLLGHLGLLAILIYVWATAMTANTAKTRDLKNRVDNLVTASGAANGRIGGLSGHNTTTNGLTDGTINGHTDTASLTDGTISGSTGQINTGGGTAHTHGPGSLAVQNGQHQHGANATNGTLAVANGQHSHTLPSV